MNNEYLYAFLHLYRQTFRKTLEAMLLCILVVFTGCAKMGAPDGGWYDETPPKVIGATPADKGTEVKSRKINIYFDEFVTISNPNEKVVVSPPQLEDPIIKSMGKHISVELKDTLKANTTYTVDFSDAISDNNEGNPLGNYTYSFATGSVIDTMEVAGKVLESENLEPIKGILVGLYSNLADSAFTKYPMLRVSRTDSRGHFVIKGVAPGSYRVYALQDVDNNYIYTQKAEKVAFMHDIVVPSLMADTRQDTLWSDSLHIKAINRVEYTHFLPDRLVLRAFTPIVTDRYLIKTDRIDPNHFTLFFSYGSTELPHVKGLNFNEKNSLITEASAHRDTVTYWLRDTALVNQDTLRMEVQYLKTDSVGQLVQQTDTLELLAKESYAQRLKKQQREFESWQKEQKKHKDKGEPYEQQMKPQMLKPDYNAPAELDPDRNISIVFPTPLHRLDSSAIHLYAKHDSLWYRSPFEIKKLQNRRYELRGEWRPDIEYSLEIDSMAFEDIYGHRNAAYKQGFKVRSTDVYSTLMVNIDGMTDSAVVVQLLDGQDKVVKQVSTNNGTAEFFYLMPGKYYMRLFVDSNGNGLWDTGDYQRDLQPETVYYYPGQIECKAKWDVTESWNPTARPLDEQKPGAITKQKADKDRKIQHRNAQRARDLGITYIPNK